jgi:hypothetical protein
MSSRSETPQTTAKRLEAAVGRPSSRPAPALPSWKHRDTTIAKREPTPEPEAPSRYPRVFQLYPSTFGGFGRSSNYSIAEEPDKPLFGVGLDRGLFGAGGVRGLQLYAGPTKADGVLAEIRTDAAVRRAAGSGEGYDVLLEGARPDERLVRVHRQKTASGAEQIYRFGVKVSSGWERPEEIFEWRGGRAEGWQTWKLLRLGAGVRAAKQIRRSREAMREDSDQTVSDGAEEAGDGDEEEIVAVWTIFKAEKRCKFEFVNSATLGRMGERFATLAIMTALGIWNDGKN